MNSVSGSYIISCALWPLTITQFKVISGHQVKVKKIGKHVSDFRKERENDHKTLFEASKSVKNKIRKIMIKSQNDVKGACF